jgi:fumarate reductase (CoM/CoB) subunit B
MKRFTVTVYRYNPAKDHRSRYQTYTVAVEEGARVLHVLHAIHAEDPTLGYRYCCGTGQCGSCAVRVNGEPVLACMTEAREGMIIEPLNLPVKKDLLVDMEPVLAKIASIAPKEEVCVPTRGEVEALKPLRSCIECLACVSVCPAMEVAEFAGPLSMKQEMRLAIDPRDSCDRISDAVRDGLFTCTTCQYCWKVCPKKIEIPGKAIEKLRRMANLRGLTLPRHREVAALVAETGRSVPRNQPTFLEQAPEVIEPAGPVRCTVGFFVGCMYNNRLPQTALDAMEVLARNGIRVIIPREQVCCGSPLIRTGQTDILPDLMGKNIAAFTCRGIDTVVAMCAGCGSTLKNDYRTPFVVKDINELLCEIGIEEPARLPTRVAYHDPCHLLRGQGIERQPRELIRKVAELVEIPVKCCGAGGGTRSGQPEVSKALAVKKEEEIEKAGVECVVSSCPFCEFHIGEHSRRPVKNVTTLLLEGYRRKDQDRGGEAGESAAA